jgi:hypothetical protein
MAQTNNDYNLGQFRSPLPGRHYPTPIVDPEQSSSSARDLLWAHKNHPQVKAENARILRVHTKR